MRGLLRLLVGAWVIGGLGAAGPAFALDGDPSRFVVISNGEAVGELRVEGAGSHRTVDYHVDDNGRGPRTHETLDLGRDGLPRRWSIAGQGETGVRAHESFERSSTRASWRTDSDRGSVRLSRNARPMYLAQAASPFAYALYARALLHAPGHTLDALPSGTLRLEAVTSVALPSDAPVAEVYALWGLGTAPVFVLFGTDEEFLAVLDTGRLILPAGWQSKQSEWVAFAASLDQGLLLELSRRLVHRWDAPVYLRNVRVFDPVAGVLSDPRTVVTFRGQITALLPPDAAIAKDGVAFDGENGVVVPALVDMHAHLSAWDTPLYLAAGVTTVRDMGNDNQQLLALRSRIDSGQLMGPRVVSSGFLEGRSPFSARDGFVVSSLPEALESVQWYAERGYWQVKLYNSINPDWVAPVAQAAHRLGMRVAGHVPAFMSSTRAIRDGYDEVTHLNQLLLSLMIDSAKEDTRTPFRFTALGERTATLDLDGKPFRDLLALMKDHHTVLDPTAAILSEMLLSRAGQTTPVDAPWIDHMPGPVQRARRAAMLDVPPSEDATYRQSEKQLLKALLAIHDAGIPIVPGTDDAPGFMLQSELETWQRAGMAPREILRLATVEVARYLGLGSRLGTIERGKLADLMLVAGDPTVDVHALRQVRLVMKEGAVIFPDEVYRGMEIRGFVRGVEGGM